MKILILSSGRSGSSSLHIGLKESILNSSLLFEPFNPKSNIYISTSQNLNDHINQLNNLSQNNTVIEKNLIFFPESLFPKNTVDFYLKYIKNFDKTILLARKDTNQIAQSFSYSRFYNKWHEKYYLSNKIPKNFYENQLKLSKIYNNLLFEISNKSQIPIDYYEDLFKGDLKLINNFVQKKSLKINNIEVLYNYLSPKNKYRQN